MAPFDPILEEREEHIIVVDAMEYRSAERIQKYREWLAELRLNQKSGNFSAKSGGAGMLWP